MDLWKVRHKACIPAFAELEKQNAIWGCQIPNYGVVETHGEYPRSATSAEKGALNYIPRRLLASLDIEMQLMSNELHVTPLHRHKRERHRYVLILNDLAMPLASNTFLSCTYMSKRFIQLIIFRFHITKCLCRQPPGFRVFRSKRYIRQNDITRAPRPIMDLQSGVSDNHFSSDSLSKEARSASHTREFAVS